jgi:hypothetical protein
MWFVQSDVPISCLHNCLLTGTCLHLSQIRGSRQVGLGKLLSSYGWKLLHSWTHPGITGSSMMQYQCASQGLWRQEYTKQECFACCNSARAHKKDSHEVWGLPPLIVIDMDSATDHVYWLIANIEKEVGIAPRSWLVTGQKVAEMLKRGHGTTFNSNEALATEIVMGAKT